MKRYPRFTLDIDAFFERHWQREPLLIRQALPRFHGPIDPDDLAGLAGESAVESRIIGFSQGAWALENGPFQAWDFRREDDWTLLVQGVDHWIPEVAALRACVDFLPSWRFDDVMVSYAVNGGSVGPHFDRYDVFLLQGMGQRRWRVGQHCDESTPRLDHDSLHLLERFDTVQEYLLEPGDALYVPPGVAHWGVAEGESMTYSLGFRAPRVSEILARLSDDVLPRIAPGCLLKDRGTAKGGRPGEITEDQVDNARHAAINALLALDDGAWLGELVTETGAHSQQLEAVESLLPGEVMLDPAARVAWKENAASCTLFANGDRLETQKNLIPIIQDLCAGNPISQDGETVVKKSVAIRSLNVEQSPALRADDVDFLLDFLIGAGALKNIE